MVTLIQEVDLSLTQAYRPTLLHMRQYDNMTRQVKCSVYLDGSQVSLDDDTVVMVSGTCPDRSVFQLSSSANPDVVFVSDGCACFWITDEMTYVAGKFPVDVTLTNTDGLSLGTFSLIFRVAPAAVSGGQALAMLSTGVSLAYDDTYTIPDGYTIVAASQSVTSYSVSKGTVSASYDSAVVDLDGTTLTATGVGTASLLAVPDAYTDTAQTMLDASSGDDTWLSLVRKYGAKFYKVTVSPANLTVMYLCGQSNAEGAGGEDPAQSVACDAGTVYSTYVPATTKFTDISGIALSPTICTADDAGDYVAGSLTGTKSVTGETLIYPVNSLTTAGGGKKGPDSGLAYEWNQLTGDKVWVINAAQSSSSITQWVDGDCWEMFTAVQSAAAKTLAAEVAAGHYTLKNTMMFWQQGEADKDMSAAGYLGYFKSMCQNMNALCSLDAIGIITIRAYYGYGLVQRDVNMTAPRAVQYAAGAGTDDWCANVYIASNTNELWTTADGVEEYFAGKYSTGYLDYPMHTGSEVAIPTTVEEVHDKAHYTQYAYNENGFTAAEGMYAVLRGTPTLDSVVWKGFLWTDLDVLRVQYDSSADEQDAATAVPVAEPCYAAKGMSVSVSGTAMTYDAELNAVTPSAAGTSLLSELATGTNIAAKSAYYEMVKFSNGVWYYCADGTVDTTYTGTVKLNGSWYYVEDGVLTWSYTGPAVISTTGDLWYFTTGYLDGDYTGAGLYDGRLYYFTNGEFDDSYNGTAEYNDTTYTFVNGVSTESGITDGTVEEDTTTHTYYLVKVDDVWCVYVDGELDASYTGMAKIESTGAWYYCTDGAIDYTYTGCAVSPTSGAVYYVESGTLSWTYTGYGVYDGTLYYFSGNSADGTGTAVTWNLLSNTQYFSDSSTISANSEISGDSYGEFTVLYKDNSSGSGVTTVCEWADALEADGDAYYTLSFYAKGTGAMRCQFFGNDDTVESGISSQGTATTTADGNTTITLSDTWTRYWVTWHTLSGISGARSIRPMRLTAGSTGYICGIKLEAGYTATDWTPSKEDMA